MARILIWVLALMVMLGAAIYQRRTGPTYPLRGSFEARGETVAYRLIRSGTTGQDARVELPHTLDETSAALFFKRLGVDEPFTEQPMKAEDGRWTGSLPSQPPAGKLEYYVERRAVSHSARLPERETAVIRFKDHVPIGILLPHVLLMFVGMWIGVAAALGSLLRLPEAGRLAWIALGGLTIGGMMLGPVVQRFAFGAYWTGWPFGTDLTDNKTALMWVTWIVACLMTRWNRAPQALRRGLVVIAALVMLAVYAVPHSVRGSQLDYSRLESVADPHDAIETGR